MQHCFDNLYIQSVTGQNFYDSMNLISSNENIRLAYKHPGSKAQALKKINLKECYIVRYADDFKVLCRTRSQTTKMNHAIKDFLSTRLHLETSEEKSKVINLKKKSSEFLGFSFRVKRKGKTRFGHVAQSNMRKKAKSNALIKIKDSIKSIKKKPWN